MKPASTRGFTMIELIVVIILIGILGAIGLARFFDSAAFDAAGYAEQTKAMLRYAQKIAVAQRRPVYVVFGSNRIALCFNYNTEPGCSGGNRVLAPGGANSGSRATVANCASSDWYCEGTPSNLAYTRITAGPAADNFAFDALGRPFAAADTVPGETSSFVSLVVRITGDGRNHDLTISPETGYVY